MADDPYVSEPLSKASVSVGPISGFAQVTDYTVSDIATAYQGAVGGIQTVLQGTGASPSAPPTLLQADADKIEDYVELLRDLLVSGLQGTVSGGALAKYYMTSDMTDQLGALFSTLQQLGVTIPPTAGAQVTMTLAQANALQELSATSLVLQSLFAYASTAISSNRSLQTLIELDFVKTGNNLLGDQLDRLEQALSSTQTTINNLTTLQELHNQITIQSTRTFPLPAGDNFASPSAFQSAYVTAASGFFKPIAPVGVGIPLSVQGDPSVLANYEVVNGLTSNMVLITPPMEANYADFQSNLDIVKAPTAGQPQMIIGVQNGTNDDGDLLYDFYSLTFDALGTTPPPQVLLGTGYELANFGIPQPFGNPPVVTFIPASPDYTTEFISFTGLNTAQTVNPLFQQRDDDDNILDTQIFTSYYFSSGPPSTAYMLRDLVDALNIASGHEVQLSAGTIGIQNTNNATVGNALSLINLVWHTYNPTDGNFFNIPRFSDNSFITTTLGDAWLTYGSALGQYIVDRTSPSDSINLMQRLVTVRTTLSAQIPILSAFTPQVNGAEDPSSLLAKIKTVLSDLNRVFVTTSGAPVTSTTPIADAIAGLSNWLLDNYAQSFSTASTSGQIQQNLTFAITAGQSLNDTQKETVRRFLFVFEEYYKAASAVLQSITQLLQRIAQGINR